MSPVERIHNDSNDAKYHYLSLVLGSLVIGTVISCLSTTIKIFLFPTPDIGKKFFSLNGKRALVPFGYCLACALLAERPEDLVWRFSLHEFMPRVVSFPTEHWKVMVFVNYGIANACWLFQVLRIARLRIMGRVMGERVSAEGPEGLDIFFHAIGVAGMGLLLGAPFQVQLYRLFDTAESLWPVAAAA